MSKNTLKLYVGKAQLSGVQKMDPFLVQCSDVVSTFGQVPGGRTSCFCDNGALTQKRKPICNLSDCDNQQVVQTAMYRPQIWRLACENVPRPYLDCRGWFTRHEPL